MDKSSHRHKLDNKLDKVNGDIQRIRINIADLILYKVEAVVRSKHCVGISKHLCGDATGEYLYEINISFSTQGAKLKTTFTVL